MSVIYSQMVRHKIIEVCKNKQSNKINTDILTLVKLGIKDGAVHL